MRVRKLKPKAKRDTREMKIVYRHDRKAIRALGGIEAMKAYSVPKSGWEFMGYFRGKPIWRVDHWSVPACECSKVGAVPISSEAAYQIREKQKEAGRKAHQQRERAKAQVADVLAAMQSFFVMPDEDEGGSPVPTTEPDRAIGAELLDENIEPFDVDTCGFLEG